LPANPELERFDQQQRNNAMRMSMSSMSMTTRVPGRVVADPDVV